MICKLMKKAENHENNPRRSWALNHMGNPRLNKFEKFKCLFPQSINSSLPIDTFPFNLILKPI